MNDEYRKLLTDHWTLDYWFQGWEIAYRSTQEGVEVLAVGLPEVAALLKKSTPEEKLTFILTQP